MQSKASVLVVDDDVILLEIAQAMLRGAGYACRVARDGDAAVTQMREARPDLVVLDMIMPDKEGIETLREIKKSWPNVKVLMISGGSRTMPADPLLAMAKALGADAIYAKPLRQDTFIPLVNELLCAKGAPPASSA